MIDFLVGTIKKIKENQITLFVQGVGFSLITPQTSGLEVNKNAELFTYLHWNAEQGPSLFGFSRELDRVVFLLIIECPQIGPKIASSMLSQMPAEEIINAITTEDGKKLSSINGIGEKKAEQMIVTLKRKITKLISLGEIKLENALIKTEWGMVNEALISLGYTRQEVMSAISHLSKQEAKSDSLTFDQLMRKSLAFLSSGKGIMSSSSTEQ